MLATKINVVAVLPQSGDPDVISKTQPTPAIAATQEIPRNTLLLGVIINFKVNDFSKEHFQKNHDEGHSRLNRLNRLKRKALFLEFFSQGEVIGNAIDKQHAIQMVNLMLNHP